MSSQACCLARTPLTVTLGISSPHVVQFPVLGSHWLVSHIHSGGIPHPVASWETVHHALNTHFDTLHFWKHLHSILVPNWLLARLEINPVLESISWRIFEGFSLFSLSFHFYLWESWCSFDCYYYYFVHNCFYPLKVFRIIFVSRVLMFIHHICNF